MNKHVRIAASQGWMSGFLSGMFKPTTILYKDISKAFLTMLSYADAISPRIGHLPHFKVSISS